VIFENFLKFSKRRRVVPLRPIWTTMVAAKLNQSRVPVTKFHQNRLMLKGRGASQRHTDTQTDRQTDRQTRLKIMALQVCNRANRFQVGRRHCTMQNLRCCDGQPHSGKRVIWHKITTRNDAQSNVGDGN